MIPHRKLIASALLAAALATSHALVAAHAVLQDSIPAKDAEVATAPKEITLHFNEKLEGAFSKVKLLNAAGKVIETEKASVDAADPSVMKVQVPALAPGKYTVQFVAVGHDGHRRQGKYLFTVK